MSTLKVELSKSTRSAVVTFSGENKQVLVGLDDAHLNQIVPDAKNGKLAEQLECYPSDSEDELQESYASATDWETVYEAEAA